MMGSNRIIIELSGVLSVSRPPSRCRARMRAKSIRQDAEIPKEHTPTSTHSSTGTEVPFPDFPHFAAAHFVAEHSGVVVLTNFVIRVELQDFIKRARALSPEVPCFGFSGSWRIRSA